MKTIKHLFLLSILVAFYTQTAVAASSYAVVVSKNTLNDAGWREVVDTLLSKHHGQLVTYESNVTQSLPSLRQMFPRYTCFVSPPNDVTREFIASVHCLTRRYDEDPYCDTFWAILTGYDSTNALSIARQSKPLTVHKVAAHFSFDFDMVDEAIAYDEVVKNKMVRKEAGKSAVESKGPDDTTKAMVDAINLFKPDLILASGHASEADWALGYTYRNGRFVSKAGHMFGKDLGGNLFPVDSPNPKVYMPIGNCLMGHIKGSNSMALAWMNSVGVCQMLGYTFPTWYGYSGWGCIDYFVEQPGRYTLVEAFHANQRALINRLLTYAPEAATMDAPLNGHPQYQGLLTDAAKADGITREDIEGLLFDRDNVVFYGDPGWEARMAEHPKAWDQKLKKRRGIWTFTIHPNLGPKTFAPVNTNGSQRGGRPIVEFFPRRLKDFTLLDGNDLHPVFTDDFLLIPQPATCDTNRSYIVKFKAKYIR